MPLFIIVVVLVVIDDRVVAQSRSSDARYMRVQKEQGICDQSHGSHGHNRYVRKLLPGKRCNIIYNRNLRENLGEFWQNTLRELLLS